MEISALFIGGPLDGHQLLVNSLQKYYQTGSIELPDHTLSPDAPSPAETVNIVTYKRHRLCKGFSTYYYFVYEGYPLVEATERLKAALENS